MASKGEVVKKTLIVTLIVLGVLLAIDLFIVGLVFVPPVQQKIVDVVTSSLSEKWHGKVAVGKLYLSPTFKLYAEDFVICDHKDQPMISADKLSSRLLGLELKPDIKVSLGKVDTEGVKVVVKKHKGDEDVNISIWARNFKKKKKTHITFIMSSPSIILKDAYFAYIDEDKVREQLDSNIDYAFFELKDLNAQLDDFLLDGTDIYANFKHMSLTQYTGFKLLNLTADFKIGAEGMYLKNASLVTPYSNLFMDFAFDYKDWKYYSEFLDSICIVADVRPSTFNTKDISYFAPQTKGMDNELLVSARVKGSINHLMVTDLKAKFMDTTFLAGDLQLKNIPDFFNAFITMDLGDCTVDMYELAQFMLPGGSAIPLPDVAKKLKTANVSFYYEGVLKDYTLGRIKLKTPNEHLCADFESQFLSDGTVDYNIDVQSNGVNIAKFVPQVTMIGQTAFDAEVMGNVDLKDFVNTLSADVVAQISRVNIKNYPLKNLYVQGNYANKKGKAKVNIHDQLCNLHVDASANLQKTVPEYKLSASIDHFLPSQMFKNLPLVDSVNAIGFDKVISYLQRNSEVKLSVGELSCELKGRSLNMMSGNLFVDNLSFMQKSQEINSNRIRLVLLMDGGYQKYHLSSDVANAYLSTNYDVIKLPNALLDVAYSYCGNLLPERSKKSILVADTSFKAIDLEVSAGQITPILNLFVPQIKIAEGTTINIHTSSRHFDDFIKVDMPQLVVNDKIKFNNIKVDASQDASMKLNLNASMSDLAIGSESNFIIGDIALKSSVGKNHLDYNLSWQNPEVLSQNSSYLVGVVDFPRMSHIETKVTSSKIYVKDYLCQFNNDHKISINNGKVLFDNVAIRTEVSDIMIDGRLLKNNDSLVVKVRDVDASLVNRFLKSQKMAFGGGVSANLQVRSLQLPEESEKRRVIFGSALIRDFEFNDAELGSLYAAAALPEGTNIYFNGGLISDYYFSDSTILDNYSIYDFRNQQGVNTKLKGSFAMDQKELRVNADIDTLQLRFLEPFLSSFSHKLQGDASGNIDFVLNKDSMYFDGKAYVRKAEMGISILNTIYNISGQTIEFNRDGFAFNNVAITDKYGNAGALNGYIHHQKFDNFDLNLRISTPKMLVLNTKQKPDFPFFGDAFVSGDVAIYGDMNKLYFVGDNLKTEKGTRFCLPISFADKVSESNVITFKEAPRLDDEVVKDTVKIPSEMDMEFDFTLDVTPVADILLDLDLSAFYGAIATKGSGKVHFTYDTKSDINMLGDVVLESGSFLMRFAQLLNKKFYLVPGGTVSFDGSLDNININVQAQYLTTASLADLFSSENTNIRRMPVKTYLKFNGNLSDPAAIDFSFDLPNATSDFKTLFYSTIDTNSIQKKTEQFFSLVILGKFASATPNIAINAYSIEQTGIGVLTSTLSNFISRQLKFVDVNIGYQNANEAANKATEYSVSATTSLFNDRTIIEGYFGYVDDQSQSVASQSQFIGDFSIEQKINELGTWRVKVFNVTNQDELRNAMRNSPYAQGVALIYKQDFNNRKDLIESYKRSTPRKNKKKKSNE